MKKYLLLLFFLITMFYLIFSYSPERTTKNNPSSKMTANSSPKVNSSSQDAEQTTLPQEKAHGSPKKPPLSPNKINLRSIGAPYPDTLLERMSAQIKSSNPRGLIASLYLDGIEIEHSQFLLVESKNKYTVKNFNWPNIEIDNSSFIIEPQSLISNLELSLAEKSEDPPKVEFDRKMWVQSLGLPLRPALFFYADWTTKDGLVKREIHVVDATTGETIRVVSRIRH